ncbi:MAG: hypothetical protein LBH04_03805 [Tannerellaceae bacterium]|jgi:hypothetical protein|nr:hypothetical protein [Tannerellaceae bacterium]
MNRKKIALRIIAGLIIFITLASVTAYFLLSPEKPWMAFFIACCGGVLDVNFLVTYILVRKNFKG